jgi:hypothetical protein
MKTNWIKLTPGELGSGPEHTNWVLIVIDGKTREVTDHIGLGWRKRSSDGRATGWWETSHGLMQDRHIKFWAETPALP